MVAIVVACVATAVVLCGPNSASMLLVALIDGGRTALWIGGATALGDMVLRACRVRSGGPLRAATAGGLGLGLFSLAGLGLGLLGALNRPVAIAFPAIGYALFGADLWRRLVPQQCERGQAVTWLRRPAGAAWLWGVPAVSLTMAAVAASLVPGLLWKPGDPHPYDVTSYHLQVPREWYEAGRITRLPHNMFSCFPMNAEVQSLLLMQTVGGPLAPWEAMYSCQFVSVGYTLLMLLAVAGAVQRQGRFSDPEGSGGPRVAEATLPAASGGRSSFAPPIAAGLASVVPWVVMLGGVAYVEAAVMLYSALVVAWAMRATSPTEPGGYAAGSAVCLTLAGVMAGLAAGVKITAVPMLMLAIPLAIAASRLLPWRRLLVGCAAFGIAGSIVLSPWLIRNLAWTGNPVWPVGMSVLGRDGFSPRQVERFTTAHSPLVKQRPAAARVGILWREVLAHWQYGYVLLPMAAVAAAVRWWDRQTRLIVVTALVMVVVWFGFTHLLSRFLVMLIPLAAILVGRAAAGRWWQAGLVVLTAAAACGWAGVGPALAARSLGKRDEVPFGMTNLSDFLADVPTLGEAMAGDKQIAIVGDAQAFFFQVPMTRLHYKTVFDLPADDPDAVEAWAGPSAAGNAGWVLVINPVEVARLHATYVGTPPLPAAWAKRGPDAFVLRGDQLTTETRRHGEEKKENAER